MNYGIQWITKNNQHKEQNTIIIIESFQNVICIITGESINIFSKVERLNPVMLLLIITTSTTITTTTVPSLLLQLPVLLLSWSCYFLWRINILYCTTFKLLLITFVIQYKFYSPPQVCSVTTTTRTHFSNLSQYHLESQSFQRICLHLKVITPYPDSIVASSWRAGGKVSLMCPLP